jgi:hypothetical protein
MRFLGAAEIGCGDNGSSCWIFGWRSFGFLGNLTL